MKKGGIRQVYFGLIFLICQVAASQNSKTIALHFNPIFENKPLALNTNYYSDFQKNTISFSIFKCYVSHFEFYKNHQLLYTTEDAFLLDSSKPDSMNREIGIPGNTSFDEIKFYLGIDDKTNDKGISGGDLDPAKGMYWTWQTGYINLKLEGNCKNSTAAAHEFQFHLGGFLTPFASFQTIDLMPTTENLIIVIDISRFMEKIALQETHTIMSPSETSVALSKNAALMFRL